VAKQRKQWHPSCQRRQDLRSPAVIALDFRLQADNVVVADDNRWRSASIFDPD
jgi:hypothetical protein